MAAVRAGHLQGWGLEGVRPLKASLSALLRAILIRPLRICLRLVGRELMRVPSLLALAALVGFVILELVLRV